MILSTPGDVTLFNVRTVSWSISTPIVVLFKWGALHSLCCMLDLFAFEVRSQLYGSRQYDAHTGQKGVLHFMESHSCLRYMLSQDVLILEFLPPAKDCIAGAH